MKRIVKPSARPHGQPGREPRTLAGGDLHSVTGGAGIIVPQSPIVVPQSPIIVPQSPIIVPTD